LGEVVVGLADPLGEELRRRRRAAGDEQVERCHDHPAGRPHRPHQLQVLEQHVSVVAAGGHHEAAADRQRARIVAAEQPVEQDAAGVPGGVPRHRGEVVLRPDKVGAVEQRDRALERGSPVADVVVGHDDPVVVGQAQAGEDAGHLPVGAVEVGIGRYVADAEWRPRPVVDGEDVLGRAVDDHDVEAPGQPGEVGGEVGRGSPRPAADRQDVGGGDGHRPEWSGRSELRPALQAERR
jgi:hypothetical protein